MSNVTVLQGELVTPGYDDHAGEVERWDRYADDLQAAEAERDALRERLAEVEGGMEQVGWWEPHSRVFFLHRSTMQNRPVPVYRLSDAARAALSPQEGM